MRAVFYNGNFTDFENAKIPLYDRSVFFGDGVYDVVIGCEGSLYLFDRHLDRFYGNIDRIGLTPSYTKEELKEIIKKLISNSGLSEYLVYMQATGYSERRTHARESDKSNLLLFVTENRISTDPAPVRLRTVKDTRGSLCDVKSINLLPAVLYSTENEKSGYFESAYIRDEVVTECAHSSLAIVKNGVFKTHPLSPAILPGITRGRAMEILTKIGIKCLEEPFSKSELFSSDEVLILSTTKLCRQAFEIDGVRFSKRDAKIGDFLYKAFLKEYRIP